MREESSPLSFYSIRKLKINRWSNKTVRSPSANLTRTKATDRDNSPRGSDRDLPLVFYVLSLLGLIVGAEDEGRVVAPDAQVVCDGGANSYSTLFHYLGVLS